MSGGDHREPLAALGIPDEAVARLEVYLEAVAQWNERTNLTGARSAIERVQVLVADVWRAAGFVLDGGVIDVGAGNGSPGLVLALLRPELRMTLLEPRGHRWAFLREVLRRTDRADVEVERLRIEEYVGQADTVTLRAVGIDLAKVVGHVRIGGEVLIFGGSPNACAGLDHAGVRDLGRTALHVFRRTS